jgi:hypothetical protein
LASPRPSGQLPDLTQHCAPPARTRHPCGTPVSRPILTSRGCPQMVPVSNGESISTPPRVAAQGPAAIHFKFLLYPHDVHRTRPLIRISRQLSTGFHTRNQQVAGLAAGVMRRSGDQDGLARQPPGSGLVVDGRQVGQRPHSAHQVQHHVELLPGHRRAALSRNISRKGQKFPLVWNIVEQ